MVGKNFPPFRVRNLMFVAMAASACGMTGVSSAAFAQAGGASSASEQVIIHAPEIVRRNLPRNGPGTPPGLANPEIISLSRAVSYADLESGKRFRCHRTGDARQKHSKRHLPGTGSAVSQNRRSICPCQCRLREKGGRRRAASREAGHRCQKLGTLRIGDARQESGTAEAGDGTGKRSPDYPSPASPTLRY